MLLLLDWRGLMMERPRAKLTEWKVLPDIWGEEKVYFLKGRIEGHPALDDGACAETSHITDCKIDKHTGEIIFYTENTDYHCKIADKNQYEADSCEHLVPDIAKLTKKFCKEEPVDFEEDGILIELSNYYDYYYRRSFVKQGDNIKKGTMDVHYGMNRDSCLIRFNGGVDLRFFPSWHHLRQYYWENKEFDVYFENRGSVELYITTPIGVLKLEPGQCSLVCQDNILEEEDVPPLDIGNLYFTPLFDLDEIQ